MAALGLSSREQAGCRGLLDLLGTDDLLALSDTVTNRLVLPESRKGAGGSVVADVVGWGRSCGGRRRGDVGTCAGMSSVRFPGLRGAAVPWFCLRGKGREPGRGVCNSSGSCFFSWPEQLVPLTLEGTPRTVQPYMSYCLVGQPLVSATSSCTL